MSEVILFDLDGTITDSAEGITKCVQYALGHFGVHESDLNKLKCFVGPPLKEQFIKYCNLSEKQAETAVSLYRERYTTTGIYENRVYDGIESVLRLLKANGKILGVASSKPTIYVNRVLEHFNLSQYFTVVVGSELDGSRTNKAEVIEHALELLGMQKERFDVVMVGDRAYDVEGALQCGIQCIGVAYGYGGIYELETSGAAYIAQTVEDLKILVGSLRAKPRQEVQGRKKAEQQKRAVIGFWHKAWSALYPLGIYLAIVITVTIVISLISMALNGMWYGYDVESIMTAEIDYTLLIMIVSSIIAIPLFAMMYRRDEALRVKEQLDRVTSIRKVSAGIYIATIISMIATSQSLNMLIEVLRLNEIFPHYSENVNTALVLEPQLVVVILVAGILVPIAEELVFRGLIFKRFYDYTGTIVAILVSGLLFGIYYENSVRFIYATIIGWLLALVFNRAKDIRVPIAGHIGANLWSIIIQRVLPQAVPTDDISKYIVLGVLIAVVVLSLIYITRNKVK